MPTVRDFIYRNKLPRKESHKYIVRTKALKKAKTHNGDVKLGYIRRLINPEVLAFFHYLGLTTNWKSYYRQKPEDFDPNKHRKDSRQFEQPISINNLTGSFILLPLERPNNAVSNLKQTLFPTKN